VAETSEGAQELAPRGTTTAGELRSEVGAVLRLPEGGFVDPGDIDIERRDDQTMIINMGPQHPSTHGVLRLMLELDGETVLRTKPIIGYLHTGMEKTGEELTYTQGSTNVTRMDYLSPLHNELVFSLATEALLDGRTTGLQVTVSDSASNTFGAGTPSCTGTYPHATPCSSTDDGQAVPGAVGVRSWSDTFTISWSLPLAAGNPYEGGSATVTVTAYYNGTPAPSPSPSPTPPGGVSGISSGPSPTGGVSAASTPSTGAGPIPTSSLVLIALGMVLLLAGAYGIGAATRLGRRTP